MENIHLILLILSGIFVLLTLGLSVVILTGHVINYNKPDHQRYIVRILLMPAIYAIDSWLSLYFEHNAWAIFIDIVRDCYEAYVIYSFFKLLSCYLGGREAVNTLASTKQTVGACSAGGQFYRRCLQGVLQYVVVKPAMAILAAALHSADLYAEGNFATNRGYLYITIVNNISVTLALYYLGLFYNTFRVELNPHSPVLKFLVIKGVIFFTYWQSVAIAVASAIGIIPSTATYSTVAISWFLNDSLVCVEMFVAAIMHMRAFPYQVYRQKYNDVEGILGQPLSNIRRMQHHLPGAFHAIHHISNQRDVIDDTAEALREKELKVSYKKFKDIEDDDESRDESSWISRDDSLRMSGGLTNSADDFTPRKFNNNPFSIVKSGKRSPLNSVHTITESSGQEGALYTHKDNDFKKPAVNYSISQEFVPKTPTCDNDVVVVDMRHKMGRLDLDAYEEVRL